MHADIACLATHLLQYSFSFMVELLRNVVTLIIPVKLGTGPPPAPFGSAFEPRKCSLKEYVKV